MPAVYLFSSAAMTTNPPPVPRQFTSASTSPPIIERKAIAIIASVLVLLGIVTVFAGFFLCCYGRRSCLCYRYRQGPDEPKRLNTGSSDTSIESIQLQNLPPAPKPPRSVLKKFRRSLPSRQSTQSQRGDYGQNAEARHYRTNAALDALGIERRVTVHTQPARLPRDSLELVRGWPVLEDVPLDGR